MLAEFHEYKRQLDDIKSLMWRLKTSRRDALHLLMPMLRRVWFESVLLERASRTDSWPRFSGRRQLKTTFRK